MLIDILDIIKKTKEFRSMNKTSLNNMFKDVFYYWKLISWDNVSDLRETNPYYKPLITEEEFQILQDRYYQNPTSIVNKSKIKDEYEEIKTFESDFLITEDNFWLTFNLPNKKRFENKILEAWKNWKKVSFKDVVASHQINYRCANKESKNYWVSVTQDIIDKEILKVLKDFKVSEKDFKKYVDYTNKNLENIINTTKEKQTSLNLQIWRLKSKKEAYIKNNMSIAKDEEEKRIYENEKENFDKQIKFLRKELEIFIDVLNNAKNYYEKANYVQKGKIAKILFLNITVKSKKELVVHIKPELQTLFNPIWWN